MDNQEIMKTLTELKDEIKEIKTKILPRIEFQMQTTDSGIQISGGPTVIFKKGVVIGSVPLQNGIGLLIKEDGQQHVTLADIRACRWIED